MLRAVLEICARVRYRHFRCAGSARVVRVRTFGLAISLLKVHKQRNNVQRLVG